MRDGARRVAGVPGQTLWVPKRVALQPRAFVLVDVLLARHAAWRGGVSAGLNFCTG